MSRGLKWELEELRKRGWRDPDPPKYEGADTVGKLNAGFRKPYPPSPVQRKVFHGVPHVSQDGLNWVEEANTSSLYSTVPPAAAIQPRQRTRQAKAMDQGLVPVLCHSAGLPQPRPEYRFHPKRRWRFDWAWPIEKVAVEIDGGAWTQGRHTRGKGFIADQQKLNAAVLAGWRVLRYTPDRLDEAIGDLKCLLL